jgi:hypothetical protein
MPAKQPPPSVQKPEPATDQTIREWLELQSLRRRTFTSRELEATIVHMSQRQLQWWTEEGVISPQMVGHQKRYTPQITIWAGVVADLRHRGVTLQTIRRRQRTIQQMIEGSFPACPAYLLVSTTRIDWSDDAVQVGRWMSGSRTCVWLVSISEIMRRLYERLQAK